MLFLIKGLRADEETGEIAEMEQQIVAKNPKEAINIFFKSNPDCQPFEIFQRVFKEVYEH